ncbi:hypothetical protein GGQ68_000229 [Sagittula marina]|uniref:Porin n=1 Tax=Sagittula marina TaxID=943940 RepID=A0A7W6DJ01_9RHOB|nr:hypothetical protein [Sagittula marina]MBB3983918.1 hypothetical protein [Sagittula marina]
MKSVYILLAATALGTTAASAQELTFGEFEASYGEFRNDDAGDFGLTTVHGEVGIGFGAADAWVSGTSLTIDPEDANGSLSLKFGQIGAGYTFGSAFRADLSQANASISLGGVGLDLGAQELGVAYDNGTYFGRLSYTRLDNNDTLGIDSLTGLHVGYVSTYGVTASLSTHIVNEDLNVDFDPLTILSVSYDTSNWSANLDAAHMSIEDVDLSALSLSGDYAFNTQWMAYGSASKLEADGIGAPVTAKSLRVGGAYSVGTNAKLFADLGTINVEGLDDNVNNMRVGINMSIGNKAASRETTVDRLTGVFEPVVGYDF